MSTVILELMQQHKSTEYRLKAASSKVKHSVMILNSKSVTINDFSPPVRLTVDERVSSEEEDPALKATAANRASKRRTRILNQAYNAEEDVASGKPLLLEDYDCQHSFVGKAECGQDGRYVFLVNQVHLVWLL